MLNVDVFVSSRQRSFKYSPDWSGNPFCGAKRNKKIATESGTEVNSSNHVPLQKNYEVEIMNDEM